MLVDCEEILKATTPQELFGSVPKRANIVYRRLARQSHPDMFLDPQEKQLAGKAFAHLCDLWEAYNNGSTTTKKAPLNTIKTKRHNYSIQERVSAEGVFVRHAATYDDGHEKATLLFLKNPAEADLGQTHATRIKELQEKVPEMFRYFYPEHVETFRHQDDKRVERLVVAQKVPEGFVPATKILEVYPNGIHGRDIAWIFKRMLVAVGNAHDQNIVHGAPTLAAFLIHPEHHGIILDRWEYSVDKGKKMVSLPLEKKDIYPSYVFDGKTVDHSLDINILADTITSLLQDNAPVQFKAFFKACKMQNTLSAARLLTEFGILLERLYGEPKFHPFTLEP